MQELDNLAAIVLVLYRLVDKREQLVLKLKLPILEELHNFGFTTGLQLLFYIFRMDSTCSWLKHCMMFA